MLAEIVPSTLEWFFQSVILCSVYLWLMFLAVHWVKKL